MPPAADATVAFILASTQHGTLVVNRLDYHQHPRGTFGVGHQLLARSVYDPQEVDLVLKLLQLRREFNGQGVVAIDCGANIGVHTVEWARLMRGWGEVLAIEAQERIFYALAGNLAINNLFNARAIWAAAGAENGSLPIPVPDYCQPASFGSLSLKETGFGNDTGQAIDYRATHRLQPVRLLSLDSLAPARVDLIKIDVEGMEAEVLRGAADLIARCTPVLVVEHLKSDRQELGSILQGWGYQLFEQGLNLICVHQKDPVLGRIQVT